MVTRDSQGFTAVETLLVLILVAIVGYTGYYVYRSQQDTKAVISSANSAVRAPIDYKKSLVISEWGVSLPLGKEVSAITYKLQSDDSGQSADISLDGSDCTPLATIFRGKATDNDPVSNPDGEGTYQAYKDTDTSKHVGDYYYDLVEGNGQYCFKGETNKKVGGAMVGAKTDMIRGEIEAAFNSIVRDK